uniref:Uncharacterized protein n=1 Tax=Anguilla anguilla TaxID=7936 RepID=A0A0E9R747_ANGAN
MKSLHYIAILLFVQHESLHYITGILQTLLSSSDLRNFLH